MKNTMKWKVIFHKPTGKWLMVDMADALYGFLVDNIQSAKLYEDGINLERALDGVDFQFNQIEPENFELQDVIVTYRQGEKICTFEELKEHVRKLNELLKDPQPGLMGWASFYGERMKAISDYWENN